MATLYVRNLPDDLYERLQELAKAENRSINAQVITLLQQALPTQTVETEDRRRKDVPKLLGEIRLRREQRSAEAEWPDSTELIREDRAR
jgi:plasmid stability protein